MNQDRWIPIFSKGTLDAGKKNFDEGKVSSLKKANSKFTATVRGIQDRDVQILVGNGNVVNSMVCDCVYAKYHHTCRHLAAALYAIESQYGELTPKKGLPGEYKQGDMAGLPSSESDTQANPPLPEPYMQLSSLIPADENRNASEEEPKETEDARILTAKEPPLEKAEEDSEEDSEEDPGKAPSSYSLSSLADMQKEQQLQRQERFKKTKEDHFRDQLTLYQACHFSDSFFVSPLLKQQAMELVQQRHYDPIHLSISKNSDFPFETHVCTVTFDSIVPIEKNGWSTQIIFSPNKVLRFCCRAKEHPAHEGIAPICAHEVAAVLLSREYIRSHSHKSFTDEVGERLLSLRGECDFEGEKKTDQTAETPGQASVQAATSSIPSLLPEGGPRHRIVTRINGSARSGRRTKTYPYSLSPVMDVSREMVISAGIQVSNIPLILDTFTLVKGIKRGKPFHVGGTMVEIRRENLSPESQAYLGFVEELIRKNKELTISQKDMDTFFRFGLGHQVLVRFLEETPQREVLYTFWDGKLPSIQLKITPESHPGTGGFSGLRLSGNVPLMVFGEEYNYFFLGQNFVRSKVTSKALREILALAKNGRFTAHIGHDHLNEFIYQTLPWMQQYVNIPPFDPASIQAYLPTKEELILYLDVLDGEALCKVEACIGNTSFPLGPIYMEDKRVPFTSQLSKRNLDLEKEVIDLILTYWSNYDTDKDVFYISRTGILHSTLFTEGMEKFYKLCEVRATERFRSLRKKRFSPFEMNVSLVDGDLSFSFSSEYTEEELANIMSAVVRKTKYVKLKSGELINVERDSDVQDLIQLMNHMHVPLEEFVKGKMSIPAYRALYLNQMLLQKQNIYIQRNEIFSKLLSEVQDMGDASFDPPKLFQGTLRPYQLVGYRWLRTLDRYGFGGILADEMGLGKTPQTISTLLGIYEEEWNQKWTVEEKLKKHLPSLIICPASLVFNWLSEIKKFAPALSVDTIAGPPWLRMRVLRSCKNLDVVITSYNYVRRDIEDYKNFQFRFVILDEAQYIKNYSTNIARSVKLINGRSKLALTGTPLENHLSDLWSIFDFLMPGFLYSHKEFVSQMEYPIALAKNQEKLEELKRMITPFILRRLKKDVLKDLPDKLEEIKYAAMDEDQRRLYNAITTAAVSHFKVMDSEGKMSRLTILTALTQLRQVCCDPSLYDLAYRGESAKRELCMELVRSLVGEGHKAIIFSQFTSMLDILKKDLDGEEIAYYEITGATESKKRVELVNKFNHNDVPIFLVSLKAGGTGLNLTGADVVIHYDPWWNRAAENQATDRAHRIGQTRVVTVYKLIVKNSIEEKILLMQEQKQAMADEILSGEGISDGKLSKEDLLSLFEEI